MTYYILLQDDTEKDAIFSSNILGEESFGVFYPNDGFTALFNISRNAPELLSEIKIVDDKKNTHTLPEFLSIIDRLQLKKQ